MPVAKAGWRVTVEGLEHVPANGSAILAPNHISVLDSFVVPMVLPRSIAYVGKAEYMDDWKTKVVFPALGMIPIDRSGGESAQRALDAAAEVLNSGNLFGIYPEGTRSRNGKLHKGHTGVARLALRTGSPIVPVGILGTDLVQPPDTKFPRPFRNVHIRFGKPVDVTRYLERADDRLILRQITRTTSTHTRPGPRSPPNPRCRRRRVRPRKPRRSWSTPSRPPRPSARLWKSMGRRLSANCASRPQRLAPDRCPAERSAVPRLRSRCAPST